MTPERNIGGEEHNVYTPSGQHLVGFVENEQFNSARTESPPRHHVVHPSGGADDDVHSHLQFTHVVADVSTSDTSVAFHVHEVAEGGHDLRDLLDQLAGGGHHEGLAFPARGVDLLKDGDREGSRLAGTGLRLRDNVVPPHAGHYGPLLDGRRLLEAVRVDTPEEVLVQVHVVEIVDDLMPIGVDEAFRLHDGSVVRFLLRRWRAIVCLPRPIFTSAKRVKDRQC